jgi:hypothetical protein
MFDFLRTKQELERVQKTEALQALQRLRQEFYAELAALEEEALAASATGSPPWDARLRALDIEPEDSETRRSHAQDGVAQACGAPLLEVEQAVARLCDLTLQALDELHRALPFCGELREFQDQVHATPGRVRLGYTAKVKPKATMNNIFTTALATTMGHATQGGARKLSTLRCKRCGSPRGDEQEIHCRYCGSAIFI